MKQGDKYDLQGLYKDLAVQLRYVRNSNQASEFNQILVHAACELELMVKGALFDLSEVECDDNEQECAV
jgi:hypothetical protein